MGRVKGVDEIGRERILLLHCVRFPEAHNIYTKSTQTVATHFLIG